MRRGRWFVVIALVVALLAARSAILFVDQGEYAYVTQFGRPVATYDGAADAGLHWKWPWPFQDVTRIDRRLQVFDVPTQEFLVRDRDDAAAAGAEKPLPLTFDLFVCWRVGAPGSGTADAAAVDQFVRSFGTPERAETFLRTQVVSRLKVELADILLSHLVNTDPGQLRLAALAERVRTAAYRLDDGSGGGPAQSLEARAAAVGIAVVDVRLRRFNHPVQVRDELFARIREDRRREAETYRNQGAERAAQVRAEGDREAKRVRTEAEAERVRLEGRAEADAVRTLNEAHAADPELYRLVRLLRGYRQMFGDDKTQLILSLDHPLLSLFRDLPGLPPSAAKPPSPPNGNGKAAAPPAAGGAGGGRE